MAAVVAAEQQRVGGQHDGREERRAQQRAAHLLEHDAELDVAEPGAAELLGDVQALQAHLLGHLRPHGLVVAASVSICSRTADLGALESRKARTILRSSSCSSVKAKFMAGRSPGLPAIPRNSACVHLRTHGGPRIGTGLAPTSPPQCGGPPPASARRHRRRATRRRSSARSRTRADVTIDALVAAGAVVAPRAALAPRPPPRSPCGAACASTGPSRRCRTVTHVLRRHRRRRPAHRHAGGRRRAPSPTPTTVCASAPCRSPRRSPSSTGSPTSRCCALDLEDALRLEWDRYAVVPVDQRCLDRAAALLREQPVRLADAIQLAHLPPPSDPHGHCPCPPCPLSSRFDLI